MEPPRTVKHLLVESLPSLASLGSPPFRSALRVHEVFPYSPRLRQNIAVRELSSRDEETTPKSASDSALAQRGSIAAGADARVCLAKTHRLPEDGIALPATKVIKFVWR